MTDKIRVLIKQNVFEEGLLRLNLTKVDAAQKLEVSPEYLSTIISQKNSPGPKLREKILILFADLGLKYETIFFIQNSCYNDNE